MNNLLKRLLSWSYGCHCDIRMTRQARDFSRQQATTSSLLLCLMTLGLIMPEAILAQTYPNKPLRLVAAGAGGGSDFAARLIGQGLSASIGQPVIVDNRPGAGGLIAGEIVARALPDGHTLLLHGSAIWLAPFVQEKVPYEPIRDFAPVTLAVSNANVIVVHPSVSARSVKELITLAKARPGQLNYGSGSIGSGAHLAAELFNSMAGVDIARIPFKGAGQAVTALLGGELQVMFPVLGSVLPHIKSRKLVALAATSAKPSALFPDLPTVAASGLQGYESGSLFGILLPGKTPKPIISRLNREIIRVLENPDVKAKFLSVGAEVVGSSPDHFGATISSEMMHLGKLIKQAGIRGRN